MPVKRVIIINPDIARVRIFIGLDSALRGGVRD